MHVIDQMFAKAAREGAFDDLPGAGKPLESLKDKRPMVDRWLEQKCAEEDLSLEDALPAGLKLRKHVPLELARIARMKDATEARSALEALDAHIRQVNRTHTRGPHSNVAPLDLATELRKWRRQAR